MSTKVVEKSVQSRRKSDTPPVWKTRIVHPDQHPYPDIFDPSCPYPLFKLERLFQPGELLDAKGQQVASESLRGKSVALYFADNSKPKCKAFLPGLTCAYRTYNESGDSQKVEIIFVSLDETEEQYEKHRKRQPWLAIPFGSPLIDQFKEHYRVMNPEDVLKYGFGPRTGVPALLVIGSDGKLLQHMDIDDKGKNMLRKWDVIANRF